MSRNRKAKVINFEIHYTAFFENFEWNLLPHINVLLGKNGYGKTYLLRALVTMLQVEADKLPDFFDRSDQNASIRVTAWDDGRKQFKLTDQCLQKLKSESIPDNILGKLKTLDQNEFEDEDTLFMYLSEKLGIDVINRYGKEISEHADNTLNTILCSADGFSSHIGKVPLLAIPDSRFIDRSLTRIGYLQFLFNAGAVCAWSQGDIFTGLISFQVLS